MSHSSGLTIVTATGNRPQAFKLCEYFVSRQTWAGPLQWIIVDDGDAPPLVNLPHALVTRVFPEPKWSSGQNTLARNLLAAIPEIAYDKIVFMEDDDYYPPRYCERMVEALDGYKITGSVISRYYHVGKRSYRLMVMTTAGRASLCQTAITSDVLPVLEEVCKTGKDTIDVRLWRKVHQGQYVYQCLDGVVGIKGMPGRPGIGVGHQPSRYPQTWTSDPNLDMLKLWIGADANLYERYYESERYRDVLLERSVKV